MRSVVYRFEDLSALRSALSGADHELALPGPEPVGDGEWVLAIFEVGAGRRATASAARGVHREEERLLAFEKRDWERIRTFVEGPGSTAQPSTQRELDPPTERPIPSETIAIPLVTPAAPTDRPPPNPMGDGELLDAPDTLRPPPPAAAPSMIPTGALVLVVDDDDEAREVVITMLEAVGLVAEPASSGEDALAMLREKTYDLVVLDVMLPGIDGLEVCRSLRAAPETSTLPVFFLSARGETSDVVNAFGAGADDYLTKPFRAAELGARIFALLRRARMVAG